MNEIIDRLNAALDGRYRIERVLGEGGMATVFLAADLKHDRQVAIKVLKPELAAVIGGDRFVTEIKTTAALQHPHILPLFDSGVADRFLYYVMPFVDGESLRDRLDRERQLSVAESVKIAGAVASALQYAHERGIIHRDIKPANILLHAGEPVVADFGIALAISAAGGGRLTETGMSVGTPHYMSPEQASGDRDVNARSDIYALACVLYEMLTGDPPHTGPTAQAVLMRILTEDPRDVTDVRRSVPPNVRDALARGLEKLPADRFETADEFKRALADAGFAYRTRPRREGAGRGVGAGGPRRAGHGRGDGGGEGDGEGEPRSWGRDFRTRLLLAGTLVLAAIVGWTGIHLNEPHSAAGLAPAHRYAIADSLRSGPFVTISGQGDVAYLATADGREHVRLRRAAGVRPIEVPNTAGALFPTFSPAGDWIAFALNERELRKVQLATGTTVTLVTDGIGDRVGFPHWADDGTILFVSDDAIYRVPEVGGEPTLVADSLRVPIFPRLLPGGRVLLYTELPGGNPGNARVLARDLETGDTIVIAESGGNALWSPTGHILHGHRSGTIFAVPFDLRRRQMTGPPVPVQENVFTVGALSFFALSESGSLAYLGGGGGSVDFSQLGFAWLEMDGTISPIPIEPTDHSDARVSPDGRQIAYTRGGYIYVFDLGRGTNQRLTFEGENYHDPVWSPDGGRIAFTATRDGRQDAAIYAKDVDGRSPAALVAGFEGLQYAAEWLEDGTMVLFSRERVGAQTDILMTRVGGDTDPTPLLRADWDESSPRVSPDRTLLAYTSNETGQRHVFVREFPGMGGRWQVSAGPAQGLLAWAREGDAIFYQDQATGRVVRAELDFAPTFQVLSRTELGDQPANIRDLHPDGRRLLVSRPVGAEAMDDVEVQIMVVANWFTELRNRLQ